MNSATCSLLRLPIAFETSSLEELADDSLDLPVRAFFMRFRFDFFFLEEPLGAVELASVGFSWASSSASDSIWAVVGWGSEAALSLPFTVATGSSGLNSSAIVRVCEGEDAVSVARGDVEGKLMWAWRGAKELI